MRDGYLAALFDFSAATRDISLRALTMQYTLL
jgi:hypothetical protein